jgi:hypothetical protein
MLAALGACTSDNPEFDAEAGPVGMKDTEVGTSGSSSPSSGLVTTDSAGTSATSGGSTSDDLEGSGDTSAETGTPLDVPGAGQCPDDPFAGFEITVSDSAGALTPDCATFEQSGYVTVEEGGAELLVDVCDGACPCTLLTTSYVVGLGELGAVPDTHGGCRTVRVWSRQGELGCSWVGFSLHLPDGAPLVVGSNQLEADSSTGDVQVDFGKGEECGDGGCSDSIPHPGRYPLSAAGLDVWPDDEPPEVFFGDARYVFDNRMSYVTEACEPNVSWHAVMR